MVAGAVAVVVEAAAAEAACDLPASLRIAKTRRSMELKKKCGSEKPHFAVGNESRVGAPAPLSLPGEGCGRHPQ